VEARRAKRTSYYFLSSSKKLEEEYSSMMLFFATILSAGMNIKAAFRSLSSIKEPLVNTSRVYNKLHMLVNRWAYRQQDACILVAELIKAKRLKSFLLRLAQAIQIGTSLNDFIKIEYSKYLLSSQFEFDRAMDKLRGLSEAYSAILTSGTFVSVSMLITSGLMGAGSVSSILTLTFLLTVVTSGALCVVIYINSPKAKIPNDMPNRPVKLKRLEKIAKPLLFINLVTLSGIIVLVSLDGFSFQDVLGLKGMLRFLFPIPMPFFIAGLMLFIIGFLGVKQIDRIKDLDTMFPIFIKTLGDASAVTGSLSSGVERIAKNDYGPLNYLIRRLHTRIRIGIKHDSSWDYFAGESGSEMIRKFVNIFVAAVKNGARVKDAAYSIFDAATDELTRRRRREHVAKYLNGLVIPLQATLVAILTLTGALLEIFNKFAGMVRDYVSIVSVIDAYLVVLYCAGIVLSLSVINSLAVHFIERSSLFNFIKRLGLILIISALTNFVVGYFSTSLLEIFARFSSEVGEIPP
jgi:flagellar protein FlaJ